MRSPEVKIFQDGWGGDRSILTSGQGRGGGISQGTSGINAGTSSIEGTNGRGHSYS